MKKESESVKEEVIEEERITEFGIRPEDARVYVAVKSFLLPVRLGPPVDVRRGAHVLLSRQTADELFYTGRIDPLTIGKFFRVTENFTTTKDGEYVVLEKNDILELEREEGLQLLRERKVQQIDESEVENETASRS